MIERIALFIDSLHISVRAFEQQISASNGLIRKAITNNTDIQSKWLAAIADNYPQLDMNWLLTGHGSMLRTDDIPTMTSITSTDTSSSSDTVVLRLMDKLDEKDTLLKEKDAKIDQLQTELRLITKELATIKVKYSQSQDKEPDSPTAASLVVEAFTSESSGNCGEDSRSTKLPSGSKRLSAGKI